MPPQTFAASRGRAVVEAMVATIDANAPLLSELDGAIGDGDHGVNMRKGFLLAQLRLDPMTDLAGGLAVLGDTLLGEIGGAMGPLYGSFFQEMARVAAGSPRIDPDLFGRMLAAGIDVVLDLGGARVGDKTLIDVMVPAAAAYQARLASGGTFAEALTDMAGTAQQARESTRDLVARVGRASRLGERSRGALDAGATSCALLLTAFADEISLLLEVSDTPASTVVA